jgi:hypothetical protein
MRTPSTLRWVRPPTDYWVDRPEMEARQRVESTGTNRPSDLTTHTIFPRQAVCSRPCAVPGKQPATATYLNIETTPVVSSPELAAVMAEGRHPVPSRTRKLSPPAPMVLHGRLCGRVGHRRNQHRERPPTMSGAFFAFPRVSHSKPGRPFFVKKGPDSRRGPFRVSGVQSALRTVFQAGSAVRTVRRWVARETAT